jgi:hypothetical protein
LQGFVKLSPAGEVEEAHEEPELLGSLNQVLESGGEVLSGVVGWNGSFLCKDCNLLIRSCRGITCRLLSLAKLSKSNGEGG